ncbi:MAG: ketoacyl-ACP synthase III [Calditrichaeota bacterium]|nr:MAG: ketoacyl-ACP synthase III [Calditrichota bacterium]
MPNARIAGMGMYVPDNVVTNDDMTKLVDTTDEWIRERSGIHERRFINEECGASDLALEATKIALEKANMSADEIDFIIFATLSPDYNFPGSGVLLQDKLGLGKIGALDVRNQCSGFIYGLSVANAYIRAGIYKNILLVGAEVHSTGVDFSEEGRHIAVLFGDGAGAAIISATDEERGVLSTHLHANGAKSMELCLINPGSRKIPRYYDGIWDDGTLYPQMNGREVFKHAVTLFPKVIKEALETNGFTTEDINLLVPHQANMRITEAVAQRLKLRPDQYFSNIHKYGNTTAASIPIALYEAIEEGRVKDGDLVILAAFGSGFTWASAAIRW